MTAKNIAKLIASIVICEGAGGIGGVFTTSAIPVWYAALEKPAFTPPNSAFAPVWLTLYLLMALSVFFVWRRGLSEERVMPAFVLFWVQLIFNILWSVVFFGMKSIPGGFVLIIILWFLILATIIFSFRVSKVAGGLLIPYILWVSIASYLNAGVWMLN